jgi:hypothetical protein
VGLNPFWCFSSSASALETGSISPAILKNGEYKLFVSQTKYLTFDLPIEVPADVTATAELELEPVLERN